MPERKIKMKKLIAAILVIAVIAGGGFFAYNYFTNPERLILGRWDNTNELGYYEFKEDGTAVIGTSIIDISYGGTYVVDKESSTITITYNVASISYNDKKSFVIDGDTLTLTDAETQRVTTYTRQVDAQ